MDHDLRSTLQRLASSPARNVDTAFLVKEGQRRRRTRTLSYAALSLVVVVSGAVAVPRLVEMTEKQRVAPAETPSPDPSPGGGRSPFEDLKNGWSELPPPPEVRSGNAAFGWTGDKLIVWGGYEFTGFSDEVPQDNGFIFDGNSKTWEMMSASPLEPRILPASAWTGKEFLIWGGSDDRGGFFDDGAAYDPATDSWRSLPAAPIGARAPLSVWTGRELIVWGTATRGDRPRDGAAYDPAADTWRPIAEGPIELTDATAAWTGQEMVIFGAALHGGNVSETRTAIAAAYNPAADMWRRLPDSQLSPQASTAAWNGSELIAWDYLNNSAAYNPRTNGWRSLRRVPLSEAECVPRSVSVRGYVFGDYCGLMAVYDPTDDRWHDVSRREFVAWGFTPVAADPVVLLMGRNADTDEEAMLAYRHPAWTSREAPDVESDEVRTVVTRFMERRMQGRGAEQLIEPDARGRFRTGSLAPLYFDPELEDFEIVFIDGPLGEPTYEVGVRLIFERGSYGQTYFVMLRNGRFLITGGRHGLEGP